VEDDNGDVSKLFISMDERTKKSIEGKLKFGSRIRVLNPYFKIAESDRLTGSRVMEPKCIKCLEGVKNMCGRKIVWNWIKVK